MRAASNDITAVDKLTPVNVAVWDSGIDLGLFPKQLSTDPQPAASGAHLAIDDDGNPSMAWTQAPPTRPTVAAP